MVRSFEISSKDGFEIVYELKTGPQSFNQKQPCLCLNHNQTSHFIPRLSTLSSCNSIKKFSSPNLIAQGLVLFYQATLAHFLGGRCRFYPTCSHYALEAYEKFSFFQASFFIFKRILSCHPFSRKSSFDPVPIQVRSVQEMSLK